MRLQVSPGDQSTLKSVVDWSVKNATATAEGFLKEHKDDGTHAAITADSVTADTVTADETRTPVITGTDEDGLTLNSPTTIDLQTDDTTRWQITNAGALVPQSTYDVGSASLPSGNHHIALNGYAQFGVGGGRITGGSSSIHLTPSGGIAGTNGISFGTVLGGGDDPSTWVLHDGNEFSFAGCMVKIGRNTNGSGAPGSLAITNRGGTTYYLWIDNSGVLRRDTARPTAAGGDTGGIPYGQEGFVTPLTSSTVTFADSALNWQKVGTWVYCVGYVVFPVTADGNSAGFTNLPFTSENSNQARGGCVCHLDSSGTSTRAVVLNNSAVVQFVDASGVGKTNASLSGVTLFFDFKYRAAS